MKQILLSTYINFIFGFDNNVKIEQYKLHQKGYPTLEHQPVEYAIRGQWLLADIRQFAHDEKYN